MNITASDVKDSKLTATVTIPAADVDAAIKKAYRDMAKKYRFPGFRAGKAPRPVIDNALGKDAGLAQATNDLLAASEPQVLNELDIVPVKEGDYSKVELVKDHEDYTYEVELELRPDCKLSSYDPVKIEMPPAEVTEAEIDSQVEMLMGYHASFEDVEDRPVEADDYVTVDIENVANAEALAGERMIAMGAGSLPEAFDKALLGMKIGGRAKTVKWTPEAEGAEEASCKVKVKAIRARKMPELTDEFVKENFGFDDIAAMRDAIKLELEQDKSSKLPALKENRAVAELATRLDLEKVPEDYEQSVFQELAQQFLTNLQQRGMSLDQWLQASGMDSAQFISDLHRQANDVARESLALDSLAKHLKIKVTDKDVKAEFERAGVEDVEASEKSFVEQGRMPAIHESIRRSKAVDWLVENAEVTEVDEYAKKAEEAEKAEKKPAKKKAAAKKPAAKKASKKEEKAEEPKAEAKDEAKDAE